MMYRGGIHGYFTLFLCHRKHGYIVCNNPPNINLEPNENNTLKEAIENINCGLHEEVLHNNIT